MDQFYSSIIDKNCSWKLNKASIFDWILFSRNIWNLFQQWFIRSIESFVASNFARPATVAAASGPTEMGGGGAWTGEHAPSQFCYSREQKQIILLLCKVGDLGVMTSEPVVGRSSGELRLWCRRGGARKISTKSSVFKIIFPEKKYAYCQIFYKYRH